MKTRTFLAFALTAALAATPALALADLNVNADGFSRVVTETSQGGDCHVHRTGTGVTARCPDGSKGTMTLYRHTSEGVACEIDFWPQSSPARTPWRTQLSHQNADIGTCSIHWENATTADVTLH